MCSSVSTWDKSILHKNCGQDNFTAWANLDNGQVWFTEWTKLIIRWTMAHQVNLLFTSLLQDIAFEPFPLTSVGKKGSPTSPKFCGNWFMRDRDMAAWILNQHHWNRCNGSKQPNNAAIVMFVPFFQFHGQLFSNSYLMFFLINLLFKCR